MLSYDIQTDLLQNVIDEDEAIQQILLKAGTMGFSGCAFD